MLVSDKIQVVRLMIDTAENSKVTIGDKVVIDAVKFIKRLNVELSLLEQQEDEDMINEAFDAAASFGS